MLAAVTSAVSTVISWVGTTITALTGQRAALVFILDVRADRSRGSRAKSRTIYPKLADGATDITDKFCVYGVSQNKKNTLIRL